jgi:hypothetical protein
MEPSRGGSVDRGERAKDVEDQHKATAQEAAAIGNTIAPIASKQKNKCIDQRNLSCSIWAF